MTPYAIVGPGYSDKLSIAMPPTTLAGAQPTSALGSAGVMRRTTSTTTIAGSMDSADTDETVSLLCTSYPPPSANMIMQDDQYCYSHSRSHV